MRAVLKGQDRKHRFEFESSSLLAPFARHLAECLHQTKLLLIARAPYDWLRSVIDKCINTPRSSHRSPIVKLRSCAVRLHRRPILCRKKVLEPCNPYTLAGILRYWRWHNQTALKNVLDYRLVLVLTSTLNDAFRKLEMLWTSIRKSGASWAVEGTVYTERHPGRGQ